MQFVISIIANINYINPNYSYSYAYISVFLSVFCSFITFYTSTCTAFMRINFIILHYNYNAIKKSIIVTHCN